MSKALKPIKDIEAEDVRILAALVALKPGLKEANLEETVRSVAVNYVKAYNAVVKEFGDSDAWRTFYKDHFGKKSK